MPDFDPSAFKRADETGFDPSSFKRVKPGRASSLPLQQSPEEGQAPSRQFVPKKVQDKTRSPNSADALIAGVLGRPYAAPKPIRMGLAGTGRGSEAQEPAPEPMPVGPLLHAYNRVTAHAPARRRLPPPMLAEPSVVADPSMNPDAPTIMVGQQTGAPRMVEGSDVVQGFPGVSNYMQQKGAGPMLAKVGAGLLDTPNLAMLLGTAGLGELAPVVAKAIEAGFSAYGTGLATEEAGKGNTGGAAVLGGLSLLPAIHALRRPARVVGGNVPEIAPREQAPHVSENIRPNVPAPRVLPRGRVAPVSPDLEAAALQRLRERIAAPKTSPRGEVLPPPEPVPAPTPEPAPVSATAEPIPPPPVDSPVGGREIAPQPSLREEGTPPVAAPEAPSAPTPAPVSFSDFEKEYRDTFAQMQKYRPDQAGSNVYSEKLAQLADAHPDWVDAIENRPQQPGPYRAGSEELKAELNYRNTRNAAMRKEAQQPAAPSPTAEKPVPPPEPPKPPATPPVASGEAQPQVQGKGSAAFTHQDYPVDRIQVNVDVPQFKEGADPKTGVIPGEALQGDYNRLGTGPVVLWEKNNGTTEVITGRHRLDLARRNGEKTIPAQVVREANGFTKDMAGIFDAEANVRDGKGSVKDYARYFTDTAGKLKEAEAKQRGLLSLAKGRAGFDLGRLATDDVRELYFRDRITEQQALAIARSGASDPALQQVGTRYALEGRDPDFVANVMQAAKAAPKTGRTENLFGEDDSALKSAEEQAKRAVDIQRDIRQRIESARGASKRPVLARELGVDVNDPEAVAKEVTRLRGELQRWQNWAVHPDLVERTLGAPEPTRATGQIPGTEATDVPPKPLQGLIDSLQGAEEAARQRLQKRPRGLQSGVNPEDLADYSIIVASNLARRGIRATQWTAEHVSDALKEFGDFSQEEINQILTSARDFYTEHTRRQPNARKVIQTRQVERPAQETIRPGSGGETELPGSGGEGQSRQRGEVAGARQAEAAGQEGQQAPQATDVANVPPVETAPPASVPPMVEPGPQVSGPLAADRPEGLTSARNAWMNEAREMMGLDRFPETQRKTHEQNLEQAYEERVPERAPQIVDEILKKPRPLTDAETVGLSYAQRRIENEWEGLQRDLQAAKDPEAQAGIGARMDQLQSEFDNLTDALHKAGTEQGRALQSRQQTLNRTYSLVEQKALLSGAAKKSGRTVTPDMEKRSQNLTTRLKDAEGKLQQHEKTIETQRTRIEELEAQKQVKRIEREIQIDARRAGRSKTVAEARSARSQALADMSKKLARLQAGIPLDIYPEIGRIARSYVEEGVAGVQELVDRVYETIAPHIPDIDKRDVRDAISKYGVVSAPTAEDATLRLNQMKRAMRLMSQIEDTLSGNRPLRSGFKPAEDAPEVVQLRAELDDALNQAGMKRAWSMSDASRLKARKTTLRARIQELDRRIKTGDFSERPSATRVSDTEAETLQTQKNDLQRQYDALKPPRTQSEAVRQKATKTRLANQIQDIQRRLDAKDFAPRPKRTPVALDEEGMRLKAERDRLRGLMDEQIAKLKPTSGWERLAAVHREFILSGPSVLQKLLGATVWGYPTETAADIVGAGVRHLVPGARKLSTLTGGREAAPLGEVLRGTTRGALSLASKEPWRNAADVIKTGGNAITTLAGVKPKSAEFGGYVGRAHGAEKAFLQTAEFNRSVEMRTQGAYKQGLDVNNPEVQATIFRDSAIDAQNQILQGENRLAEALNRGIGAVGSISPGGGTLLRTLAPITRVPANLVGRTLEMTGAGIPRGAYLQIKAALRARAGIETTPEQASAILRAYKYGGLGLAAAYLGWTQPEGFQSGGYYSRDVKPDEQGQGGLKPDELRVAGHTIPKIFAHSPFLNAVQFWATVKKGYDRAGFASGLFAGTRGVAEQTPGIEATQQVAQTALGREGEAGKGIAQYFSSLFNPQVVQQYASGNVPLPGSWKPSLPGMDVDASGDPIKRKPQGTYIDQLLQQLELGIPGLRENVPLR